MTSPMNNDIGNQVIQPPSFSWYSLASETFPITQGDFLDSFPVMVPAIETLTEIPVGESPITLKAFLDKANVVIMTQSCDFQKMSDTDPVILCPRFNLSTAKLGEKSLNTAGAWGNLRKGAYNSLHLLSNCTISGYEFEYQIVDLRRVYSAPYIFVKEFAKKQGNRVCLQPPYREHLSQTFARQFMRVGLPIDLPEDFPVVSK